MRMKGGAIVYLGAPLVIVLLLVIYILISLNSPEAGHQIADSVHVLATAAKP
jgi:hypothetical protein